MTQEFEQGRVIHRWCLQASQLPDRNSRIPALKVTLLAAGSDAELTQAVRQHDILTNSNQRICSGNALWYHIGTQHFSAFTDVTVWPGFGTDLLSSEDQIETIDSWKTIGKDVNAAIQETQELLEKTQREIIDLKECAKTRNSRKSALAQLQASLSDSYLILAELELLEQASARSAYLAYLQSKQRNPTCILRDLEAPRKEYNCGVCQGGTSEDRNPIIICAVIPTQTCDEGAHIRCYSLERVPEGDWQCDACRYFGRPVSSELTCALCGDSGGLMRATSSVGDAGSGLNCAFQWCHILCAFYCPGVRPAHESTGERMVFCIDDLTNRERKCEICGRRTQAYVQCQARGCGYTFHPGCGLAMLALGWRKGTPDQAEVLCRLHRPLPIIKNIHALRERKWQELLNFQDYWGNMAKQVARTVCKRPRPWEYNEIDALEAQIQRQLQSASPPPANSFTFTVSLREKPAVQCIQPSSYNLISPDLLVSEALTLTERSSEECIQYYSDHLMARMKLELGLAHVAVNLYEESSKLAKKTVKSAKNSRSFIKL